MEMLNKFIMFRAAQMWIINDSPAYVDGSGSTKLHYVEVPTWEKNYGENDQKRSLLPGGLFSTSSSLPVFTLRRPDISSALKRGRRADNLSVSFL